MFLRSQLHLLTLEGLYFKSYQWYYFSSKAIRENVHFLMTALQKFCRNDFEDVYAHNFWTIYTLDLIFGTHEPLYM